MGFTYLQKMPTVDEILQSLQLSPASVAVKKQRDEDICKVITGESNRFLVIIGPCSAHDEHAVFEYVTRLARLNEKVQEKIVIVPRIYTNKPRTTGEGYKGMAHQPDLTKAPDVAEGIRAIRRMHIRVLNETHLSAADEMLYPENYPYLADVLSYVTVGARSVENQQHRLTISGLDVPSGMKNPTSGDIDVMLNSVQAAQHPHVFVYRDSEVSTSGNPYAHSILRGAVNHYGQCISNYHYEDLIDCAERYKKRGLVNPAIIVDTNHANSNKKYREQPRIAREIMESMRQSPLLKKIVRGIMVESYIAEGSQKPEGQEFGKSITDPCLGWEDTEKLILNLADTL
jgi:3-deoxy-7-phosphoheptulonate synthase